MSYSVIQKHMTTDGGLKASLFFFHLVRYKVQLMFNGIMRLTARFCRNGFGRGDLVSGKAGEDSTHPGSDVHDLAEEEDEEVGKGGEA